MAHTHLCQFCGIQYTPPKERQAFSKHCSRMCHNRAIGRSKTTDRTIGLRLSLLLDPEDEHYRDKVVFNSTNRPYLPGMVNLARLLINAPEHLDVDHINRDKLDNRKGNLRICTHKENMNNRNPAKKKWRTDGVPEGVVRIRNRYYARIFERINGKLIGESLGGFATAEEAHAAYMREKLKRVPTQP